MFFFRSVGRSVGLGTWAQEHQSNVHCFFYVQPAVNRQPGYRWDDNPTHNRLINQYTYEYTSVLIISAHQYTSSIHIPGRSVGRSGHMGTRAPIQCALLLLSNPMCTDVYQCVLMCTDVY